MKQPKQLRIFFREGEPFAYEMPKQWDYESGGDPPIIPAYVDPAYYDAVDNARANALPVLNPEILSDLGNNYVRIGNQIEVVTEGREHDWLGTFEKKSDYTPSIGFGTLELPKGYILSLPDTVKPDNAVGNDGFAFDENSTITPKDVRIIELGNENASLKQQVEKVGEKLARAQDDLFVEKQLVKVKEKQRACEKESNEQKLAALEASLKELIAILEYRATIVGSIGFKTEQAISNAKALISKQEPKEEPQEPNTNDDNPWKFA